VTDPDPLAVIKARWQPITDESLDDPEVLGRRLRDAQTAHEVDWLIGEVERLRDLLRSIEWYGTRCHQDITGCEDEDVCPVCDASQLEGHQPGCRLAAELRST
jgi:hypothetical protein